MSSASFRLRVVMIMAGLRELGHECVFYSDHDDCDAVIVSKRYDEETLETMYKIKEKGKVGCLIFDLCDNHFFSDSQDPQEIEKHANRVSRLKRALSLADCVTTSSSYLSTVVHEQSGVRLSDIYAIEDCVETETKPNIGGCVRNLVAEIRLRILEANLSKFNRKNERFVWFGTHGVSYAKGGMQDILERKAEISGALCQGNATLTIISNSKKKYRQIANDLGVRTFYLPWNKNTVSRALRLHSFLLLPIRPSPFTLSKSANRLVTAMCNRLRVICDMIPAYEELRNYVIAPVDKENIINAMSMEPHELIVSADDGTAFVMQEYSQSKIASHWEAAIIKTLSDKHRAVRKQFELGSNKS